MSRMPALSREEYAAVQRVLDRWSTEIKYKITLNGLVTKWAYFVRQVERGYDDSVEEYTNDLAVRNILQDVLDSVPPLARSKIQDVLRPWDERFMRATQRIKKPLFYGPPGRAYEWWFRAPLNPGGELRKDLEAESFL